MTTKVDSQAMLNTTLRDARSAMKQVVAPDLTGFKAPFSERRLLLISGDAGLVVLATLVALAALAWMQGLAFDASLVTTHWHWFAINLALLGMLAWLNDLYHIPSSHDRSLSVMRVLMASGIGLAASAVAVLLLPVTATLGFAATFWVLLAAMMIAWRYTYVSLSNALLPFHQRVLIVGRGARAKVIADAMRDASSLNYQLVGYVEDANESGAQWQNDLPTLGMAESLSDVAAQHNIHQVVVATEGPISDELFHSLVLCQANGVPVAWMPDVYEKLLHRIPVEYIDPSWGLFALQDKPIFRRLHLTGKRLLDLLIFVLALPVFAVVLPLLALAIRLDSPGSVFYKQVRSGRGGVPFTIYKFRTMVSDAEKNGAQWAQKNDARITKVGRFLRKTRLDELPQIINVLRGEMSFVGPRPERPEFIAELEAEIPFYNTRMLVKPGLTGWAQINYDYGNTVEDAVMKLQYDLYYVRYWSLWTDIYVLFRTVAVVIQFKGM